MTQIKDFTKGNITKQLVTFAMPLLLSNLLQVVYNMVDMVVVGHKLGIDGIASVSVGGDIVTFMTFIAMGFANAGQVIIAQYIGRGESHKIGRFVGTMSMFLLSGAIAVSTLALIFRDDLLRLMSTPEASYEGALHYSVVCAAGLIFIYGYNAVSAVLRGMGDSKHPFVFISIAAVTNLALDLVLVLGLGMGALGAGLATVLSQALSFVLSVGFLFRNREKFGLNIRRNEFFIPSGEMLGDLVKLGTPMAIKMAAIQFSKLFVNSFVNSYASIEPAVPGFAGIANKFGSISNLVSAALNTAGSTMVGQNIAAGEFKRVKKILLNLAFITVSIAIIFSLLICVFPEQIFGLFVTDEESAAAVALLARGFVPIAVLLFFGSALRAIMNALLNGSGNYKINFVTAILDGIVMRIGLALLFGIALDMKYQGFWLGDALAGFTPFIIGIVFYFSGFWKKGMKKKEGDK